MSSIAADKDPNEGETEVSLLLYRIAQGIYKMMRESGREEGLSSTQVQTLRFLSNAHPGSRKVGSVARRLQVAQPTATRTIDSLAEKGLIRRVRNEEDRRQVDLVLTEEGEEVVARLSQLDRSVGELIAPLSRGEKSVLHGALLGIAGRMQEKGYLSAALSCKNCKFFAPGEGESEEKPHLCRLTGESLSEEEVSMEWVHQGEEINLFDSLD